jgi:beta-fructofuranosidase
MGRYENHHFTPESQHILDYGAHFYAPQVMEDEYGRSIMFGWLWEGRSEAEQRQAGWAGVMSLPRLLTLGQDDTLHIEPAPELAALRGDHFHQKNLSVTDETLPVDVQGDCLEIIATFQPESGAAFGLKVRCAPDGSEETWILCDLSRQLVTIEREKSSLSTSVSHDVLPAQQVVRSAPLAWQPGEAVRLHVFLDKSVVEVFVNGRVTLSSRIYPARPDSQGLSLFSQNGRVTVSSLDIWQMKSIW